MERNGKERIMTSYQNSNSTKTRSAGGSYLAEWKRRKESKEISTNQIWVSINHSMHPLFTQSSSAPQEQEDPSS